MSRPSQKGDEQDLCEAYEQHDLGWQVWPAHILSASEEEARQVIAELEAGADFFTLASQRSLADDAKLGGDLGKFFEPGGAVPALREATFHLDKGQVSEPIETIDGYEVVKILDKRRQPFETMRSVIAKQLGERKWAAERQRLLEELKERWQLERFPRHIKDVLAHLRGEGDEASLPEPVFSYQTGAVSVEAVLQFVGKNTKRKAWALDDTLRLFRVAEDRVLADSLLIALAREEGRDQVPAFVGWRADRQRELAVRQLYKEKVGARVKISDEEARRSYEENLDVYRSLPGPIHLTEVLVDTEEEAQQVLARAKDGTPLEELAVQRSRRPRMEPVGGHTYSDSGHLFIDPMFQSTYRKALGETNNTDVGKIQGPLEVQGKFSIFRLDKAFDKAPVPYGRVRQLVVRELRKGKEAKVFNAFMDSLRTSAANRVDWYEDSLARLAATE